MKYILISGGVLSGIGKGVISSSIGAILKKMGYTVTAIKIDPYLNLDAGTMSPYEHGEVYVLDDGGEADLDLGNYERFIGLALRRDNNITTGKVYNRVIERERRGDYLGKTVQVVPHITDCIQEWIEAVAAVNTHPEGGKPPDFCVIELGGTVGDIESMPFIEALRQFQFRPGVGRTHFMNVHVSLVPVLGAVGEQKTKPTQASVRSVRMLGLAPDVVMCRSQQQLRPEVRRKIAFMTGVDEPHVISVYDASNLYRVPGLLCAQGFKDILVAHFGLPPSLPSPPPFGPLADRIDRIESGTAEVTIAVVGKYTGLSDSYLSVVKALQHACTAAGQRLNLVWVASDALETANSPDWQALRSADGVLVPGGFGNRGAEGMIEAIRYARESGVPYLGICLGMQLAAVEFARNVMGRPSATSEEFSGPNGDNVVVFMPEIDRETMGGNMRLGARDTHLTTEDCRCFTLYKQRIFAERHRHRYEVSPEMIAPLQEAGLRLVGFDAAGERTQVVELPVERHPFFFAVQFHPEFKSRPERPSPPFLGFIAAAARTT